MSIVDSIFKSFFGLFGSKPAPVGFTATEPAPFFCETCGAVMTEVEATEKRAAHLRHARGTSCAPKRAPKAAPVDAAAPVPVVDAVANAEGAN